MNQVSLLLLSAQCSQVDEPPSQGRRVQGQNPGGWPPGGLSGPLLPIPCPFCLPSHLLSPQESQLPLGPEDPRARRETPTPGYPGKNGPMGTQGFRGLRRPRVSRVWRAGTSKLQSVFSVTRQTGQFPEAGLVSSLEVITNPQGHFDKDTGKFTCQVPGFYYFVFHTSLRPTCACCSATASRWPPSATT